LLVFKYNLRKSNLLEHINNDSLTKTLYRCPLVSMKIRWNLIFAILLHALFSTPRNVLIDKLYKRIYRSMHSIAPATYSLPDIPDRPHPAYPAVTLRPHSDGCSMVLIFQDNTLSMTIQLLADRVKWLPHVVDNRHLYSWCDRIALRLKTFAQRYVTPLAACPHA